MHAARDVHQVGAVLAAPLTPRRLTLDKVRVVRRIAVVVAVAEQARQLLRECSNLGEGEGAGEGEGEGAGEGEGEAVLG